MKIGAILTAVGLTYLVWQLAPWWGLLLLAPIAYLAVRDIWQKLP